MAVSVYSNASFLQISTSVKRDRTNVATRVRIRKVVTYVAVNMDTISMATSKPVEVRSSLTPSPVGRQVISMSMSLLILSTRSFDLCMEDATFASYME